MTGAAALLLGLIGDNISRSQSPVLHGLAGRQTGLDVRYDRLVPKDLGRSLEDVFESCVMGGYRGINITYPYKEHVARMVQVDDPLVRAVGAVNTVIFEADGPRGHNTDYSGFMAAYRGIRGDRKPGRVLLIGAGGVGRAVAFGLAGLGLRELRLMDRDPERAEAVGEALNTIAPEVAVSIWIDAEKAADGASGLINCTPVGMVGYDGTPLSRAAMRGSEWAFDAVYTPVETQFLVDARAEGLAVLSGWELFFHQGVDVWRLFSGTTLDETALRLDLLQPATRHDTYKHR